VPAHHSRQVLLVSNQGSCLSGVQRGEESVGKEWWEEVGPRQQHTPNREPLACQIQDQNRMRACTHCRVKDVMTKKPITVTPTCDLDVAARYVARNIVSLSAGSNRNESGACRILLSKKIRRLPVIDEEGQLCGIISRSNIVKAALVLRKAA
jgi:predicted transcriptional regulator